jgi:GH24 family phage-related lysozyme (muramidase)
MMTLPRTDIFTNAEALVKAFKTPLLSETDINGTFEIGYGRKVTPGTYPSGITTDQAEDFLRNDLNAALTQALSLLVAPQQATVEQIAALVSFALDVGFGSLAPHVDGLTTSRLLRVLNDGNVGWAGEEFLNWFSYGDGQRRRVCEWALFSGCMSLSALQSQNFYSGFSDDDLNQLTT